MSNSLIPYSFTPGTKAKAQEVNANFIALSEKIEENKAYTTSQIAETLDKIDEVSNVADEQKADKNLGNTALITNCVLEAPNGVVTVIDNVVTVHKGLKVLIPNGFNEDGSIKNTIYEVPEDVEVTTVSNSYLNCIYVTPDGCFYAEAYHACEKEPRTKLGLWYKITSNQTYIYKTDILAWKNIDAVAVTMFQNVNGKVTLKQTAKPLRLLTYSDMNNITSWVVPDYNSPVGKSTNTYYTTNISGYLYIFGIGQCNAWEHVEINGTQYRINWVNNGNQAGNCTIFPLKRGDSYYVTGNFYLPSVNFIPLEGEL